MVKIRIILIFTVYKKQRKKEGKYIKNNNNLKNIIGEETKRLNM